MSICNEIGVSSFLHMEFHPLMVVSNIDFGYQMFSDLLEIQYAIFIAEGKGISSLPILKI